jgi:hypothetical protein
MLKTTTPVDPLYVTARNMESAKHKVLRMLWLVGRALGKGSMLVGWAKKEQ